MVQLVFVANAAVALLGLALCVHHAYPDRDRLAFLGTGVVYGVLLEQLVILRFEAYRYNLEDFLLVAFDVPVVIGFGWGAIIYAGYEVGRRMDLSTRALPAFVALFALHIDLAIDAVAIRVPFWTWARDGAWFGVPLGNFTGWFLVAGLFTTAWLALRDRIEFRPALGLATLGGAVAGLIALLEVWTTVATTLPRRVVVLGALLLLALAVVARDRPRFVPVDPRVATVALLYHGFYLVLLFGLGIHRDQPLLVVVSLGMIAISLILHGSGWLEPGRELPSTEAEE